MGTENVSFSGCQCESHSGNLNKVISDEWLGMNATLECVQVRMTRERIESKEHSSLFCKGKWKNEKGYSWKGRDQNRCCVLRWKIL